jgi:hypothetical protein
MNRWIVTTVIAVNFCGSVFAASVVSEADVTSWLALWQRRTGLEQWTIKLRIVHQNELPRGAAACVYQRVSGPDIDMRTLRRIISPGTAEIRVLYPAEMASIYHLSPRPWAEHAVIHELMHLVLAPMVKWVPPDVGGKRAGDLVDDVIEKLTTMLQQRRVPGGVSETRYINAQIDRVLWEPELKGAVMLQIVRAMNAAREDDAIKLAGSRN